MTNKQQHLIFIQDIITRLCNKSFLIKGWGITIIVSLLALLKRRSNITNFYDIKTLSYFCISIFWLLDSFILQSEKNFRKLYGEIALQKEAEITYSLDTKCLEKRVHFISAAFSKTLILFYGVTLAFVYWI